MMTPSKSHGRLYDVTVHTCTAQPCAVLFIGKKKKSQQKGLTEVQWNPELPLSIALPVVGFLSTDSTGTWEFRFKSAAGCARGNVFFYAIIGCHDKSTGSVTFSIKIRRYKCIEVCRQYVEAMPIKLICKQLKPGPFSSFLALGMRLMYTHTYTHTRH